MTEPAIPRCNDRYRKKWLCEVSVGGERETLMACDYHRSMLHRLGFKFFSEERRLK